MGELQDDNIQCGYHGMTFDAGGQCVRVPGQTRIPATARVRSYPVAENMGLVWIWMGDPQRADRAEIFDLEQYHQPGWGIGHGDALYVKAHYLSLADNLCDPAHVSFVHKTTLGSAAGADIPVHSERRGATVLTWRWTLDSAPVGFFQVFGDFTGNVDRWQYYYLHAPSTAIIDFGSADAGSGAPAGDRSDCIQVYSCHFLTPVTATTTIDYWLHVRNFAAEDEAVSERISEQFRVAFAEDKVILEAIQQREQQFPDRQTVRIACDAGPGRLRQVITEMLERENKDKENKDKENEKQQESGASPRHPVG
jgi:vanillate O-demethylase monooxygenase subunit